MAEFENSSVGATASIEEQSAGTASEAIRLLRCAVEAWAERPLEATPDDGP